MSSNFLRLATLALALGVAASSAPSAQPKARFNVGVTNAEEVGVSASLSTTLATNLAGPQSSVLHAIDVGIELAYLGPYLDIGPPCPPSLPPDQNRCPHGSDWIVGGIVDLGLFESGPLQLWGTLGGGVAIGSEGERTDPTQTVFGGRSAATIIYGARAEYWLSQSIGVHTQFQGFSVFTGEREFIGPIGPFTADVGTEFLSLVSAGVGIRL